MQQYKLPAFMIYHRVSNYINTTGNTNGAETSYPSRVTEFTPGSCYSIFSFRCNVL